MNYFTFTLLMSDLVTTVSADRRWIWSFIDYHPIATNEQIHFQTEYVFTPNAGKYGPENAEYGCFLHSEND